LYFLLVGSVGYHKAVVVRCRGQHWKVVKGCRGRAAESDLRNLRMSQVTEINLDIYKNVWNAKML
jgi:hypothetical protein